MLTFNIVIYTYMLDVSNAQEWSIAALDALKTLHTRRAWPGILLAKLPVVLGLHQPLDVQRATRSSAHLVLCDDIEPPDADPLQLK